MQGRCKQEARSHACQGWFCAESVTFPQLPDGLTSQNQPFRLLLCCLLSSVGFAWILSDLLLFIDDIRQAIIVYITSSSSPPPKQSFGKSTRGCVCTEFLIMKRRIIEIDPSCFVTAKHVFVLVLLLCLSSTCLVFSFTPTIKQSPVVSRPPVSASSRHRKTLGHFSTAQESEPQFAALNKGQPITIQVGDVSQARKAWKKRRRRDSPLLIPCTLIGIDRVSLLRFSIMHLLHAFGRKLSSELQVLPGDVHGEDPLIGDGVALPVSSLAKLYKQHLYGDLNTHAHSLNYNNTSSLLQGLFDSTFEDEYGIQLIYLDTNTNKDTRDPEPYITSTLSYRPARKVAQESIFLQFISSSSSSSSSHEVHMSSSSSHNNMQDRMVHTGYTTLVNTSSTWNDKVPVLLSAALKMSQVDADARRIQGMVLEAFVLSFDVKGDNEAPLLTCAMTLPNSLVRDQMKRRYHIRHILSSRQRIQDEYSSLQSQLARTTDVNNRDRDIKFDLIQTGNKQTILDIGDLHVGDGPFKATVMRILSPRKNTDRKSRHYTAFVDLGVRRKRGKKNGGGRARVFGLLVDDADISEQDSYDDDDDEKEEEEVDEMEEDLSALFSVDDDGNLVSMDDSTITSTFIDDSEIGFEDDDSNGFSSLENMSSLERLEYIGKMFEQTVPSPIDQRPEFQVGDEIDVYIKAVFLQSGRFMVTQDSNIKNTKYNRFKKQKEADKRLSRLTTKVSMSSITENIGEECIGRIKAKSKSGLGFYVEPENAEGGKLTAGLANPVYTDWETLSQGTRVRIRLEGIDEERGQLSYSLLGPVDDV